MWSYAPALDTGARAVPLPRGDVGSPAGFDDVEVARAASRLDIRRLIGGLFILYGLILLVLGLVDSDDIGTRQPGSTSICRRRSRGSCSAR
jgi:hypothetical protein